MNEGSYTLFQRFSEPEKLNELATCLREREIDFQIFDGSSDRTPLISLQSIPKEAELQVRQQDALRVSYLLNLIESRNSKKRSVKAQWFLRFFYLTIAIIVTIAGFLIGWEAI